jgi:hypothetical protein
MRVFKSKEFARFAQKAQLGDSALCLAIAEIQAGTVDANLGGGVYKQRVRRAGSGKSGSFRTILLLRWEQLAIFVDGFRKSDQSNISPEELRVFRLIAKDLLFHPEAVSEALRTGKLIEVSCDEEEDAIRK